MELLSSLERIEPKVEFTSSDLQILDINGSKCIKHSDTIYCIPYLVEQNAILLRYESIPAFELTRPEIDKYLNVMSTNLEYNETSQESLKRGLLQQFGLELSENKNIEVSNPIFINKIDASKIYFCILPLMEYDYTQIEPTEVEKLEMNATNVLVNIQSFNNIIVYDLMSIHLLEQFKKDYSLF